MRPTMCINALRLRPRPIKFGWVSISLCYAQISVFCPASSTPLSFQLGVTARELLTSMGISHLILSPGNTLWRDGKANQILIASSNYWVKVWKRRPHCYYMLFKIKMKWFQIYNHLTVLIDQFAVLIYFTTI